MSMLDKIAETLIQGRNNEVKVLVEEALANGLTPAAILNDGLLAGMSVVGERFKNDDIYVPEVMMAARAMKAGAEVLKPLLAAAGIQPKGTVVMGTVRGDLHDIGKNLVCMMLEGAGFRVVDAGINVDPEVMLQLAVKNNAALIGASALLTTTMSNMKGIVETVRRAGLQGKVKVMVGGAPVTKDFALEIGADGYAPDAASAADLAKELSGIS